LFRLLFSFLLFSAPFSRLYLSVCLPGIQMSAITFEIELRCYIGLTYNLEITKGFRAPDLSIGRRWNLLPTIRNPIHA